MTQQTSKKCFKPTKMSWRRVNNKKQKGWVSDALLYVRISTLTNSLLKSGLDYSKIEKIFWDLGMNIEDYDLRLIVNRN